MDFEVQYTYTFEDYKQYNRVVGNALRHNKLRAAIAVVLMIGAAAILFRLGELIIAVLWIIVWMGALAIGIARGKRNLRKVWQSGEAMREGGVRYRFSPDALEVTTERGCNTYPYASLYRLLESPTHFYPMVSANQGLILPKASLTPQQEEFIRQKGAAYGKVSDRQRG